MVAEYARSPYDARENDNNNEGYMVIFDWAAKYSKAIVSGDAWKNYEKLTSDEGRDLALKVFAIAVVAGIVAAIILPSVVVPLVAIVAGAGTFSYDCVNYDFAAAAAKRNSKKSRA